MTNKTDAFRTADPRSQMSNEYAAMRNLLLVFLFAIIAYDQLLIINVKTKLGIEGDLSRAVNSILYPGMNKPLSDREIKLTGNIFTDATQIVMMKGEPALYGKKLNVAYDRVQESIDIFKKYDPVIGSFSEEQFKRYVIVTGKISCEFCCTVKALTYEDGKPMCDCDHSKAMRGLAAYLIKHYGNKYTDDEILRELARWKGVYFPKQMMGKLIREIESGNYSPDIKAAISGIELPSYDFKDKKNNDRDMENVPDMVGGC